MHGADNYLIRQRRSQRLGSHNPYPPSSVTERYGLPPQLRQLNALLNQQTLSFKEIEEWIEKVGLERLTNYYKSSPKHRSLLHDKKLNEYWDQYLANHKHHFDPEPDRHSLPLLLGYCYYYHQASLTKETNKEKCHQLLVKGCDIGSIHCCRDILRLMIATYKDKIIEATVPYGHSVEKIQAAWGRHEAILADAEKTIEPFKKYYPLCYQIYLTDFYKAAAEIIPTMINGIECAGLVNKKKEFLDKAYRHYLVSIEFMRDEELVKKFAIAHSNILKSNLTNGYKEIDELKGYFEELGYEKHLNENSAHNLKI